MAREGADIAVVYFEEIDDAAETAKFVEAEGRRHVAGGEHQDGAR